MYVYEGNAGNTRQILLVCARMLARMLHTLWLRLMRRRLRQQQQRMSPSRSTQSMLYRLCTGYRGPHFDPRPPPNRVSINTFAFGRCPSTHAHMLYSYSCSYNDFGAPASSILYANLMMGGLHFMHKWLRVDLFRTAAWIDTWTRWRNITNLQKWKSWGKTR